MPESHDPDPDLLSPAFSELLAIFEGPLAEVRFPGVDRTVLRTLVDQVRKHAKELETLRAQVDTVHGALAEAQTKLVRAAEQGLAYAKVFAASDPALSERLAEVNLPGSEEPRRRRKLEVAAANSGEGEAIRLPPKRGRKPKAAAEPEAPTGS